MEAISHAGTVLGVLSKDGIVLAAEKKVTGKLLDLSGAKEGGYGGSGEKIFLLNSCVSCTLITLFFGPHTIEYRLEMSWQAWRALRPMLTPSSTTRGKRRKDICSATMRISP